MMTSYPPPPPPPTMCNNNSNFHTEERTTTITTNNDNGEEEVEEEAAALLKCKSANNATTTTRCSPAQVPAVFNASLARRHWQQPVAGIPPLLFPKYGFSIFFVLLLLLMFFAEPGSARDITLLDCSCPRAFHPVCGADQQTYDSHCFLDCARKYDQELKLAYEGVCCPRAELCADYYDPVCDQMGNFYENDCIFDFHKCILRRTSGKLLQIHGRGERMCGTAAGKGKNGPKQQQQKLGDNNNNNGQRGEGGSLSSSGNSGTLVAAPPEDSNSNNVCGFFCHETVAPVCDSQGRTHKNRCKFELASCRLRSRGIVSALHIIREGACRRDENFGQFPSANSMRKVSMANLMEAMQRDRAKKRLNLPTSYRHSSEENNGQQQIQRNEGKNKTTKELQMEIVPARDQQKSNEENADATTLPPPSTTTATTTATHHLSFPFSEHCSSSTTQCEIQWDPLCDSANITHSNECHFRVARCRVARGADANKQQLRIAYRGKCTMRTMTKPHRPPLQCDFCREEGPFDQIVPVCDNTNLTHQSVCLFAQWNCDKRQRNVEEHVIAHLGECNLVSPIFELKDETCPGKCSRHFQPVCDSNGMTHPNLCTYQMHSCHQRKAGQQFGWLVSLRECNKTIEPLATTTTDKIGGTTPLPLFASSNTAQQHLPNQKKLAKAAGAAIAAVGIEECPDGADCAEREWGEPICDSEGRVHKNACLFARAHCLAAKAGKALRIMEEQNCLELLRQQQQQQGEEQQSRTRGKGNGNAEVALCERKWANCVEQPNPEDPYCGSDFVTYQSLCAIQKAQCLDNNVEILFKGKCDHCLAKPCRTLNPLVANDSEFVCDQSGETKSKCEFEMLRCIYEAKFGYNITAAYEGKCCPSTESCTSAASSSSVETKGGGHEQICDSRGGRHPSRCLFEVDKCRAWKIGKQRLEERYCAETMTTMEAQPERPGKAELEEEEEEQKGKEAIAVEKPGNTEEAIGKYEQRKVAAGQKQQQVVAEEVEEELPPRNVSVDLLSVNELICSDKYEPVCASDRRTYRNGCHLDRQNASNHKTAMASSSSSTGPNGAVPPPLRVLHPGECCPGPRECGPEYAPVCDSEGNTHLNLCEFGRQRCLAERMRAQNLTIVAYALCPGLHCPSQSCPSRYEPVCATNARTYANLCELDKSICVLRSGQKRRSQQQQQQQSRLETVDGTGNTLALDYIGECCETVVDCVPDEHRQHSNAASLVCDNLGRVHSCQCTFLKAACLAKRRDGQTLRPTKCQQQQQNTTTATTTTATWQWHWQQQQHHQQQQQRRSWRRWRW